MAPATATPDMLAGNGSSMPDTDAEGMILGPVASPDPTHPALVAALNAIHAHPIARPEGAGAEYNALQQAKARAMMIGYHARYADQRWRTVELEQVNFLPLINPETGAKSRTWSVATKPDGIATLGGKNDLSLLEHKTTAEDIADPAAPYWRRLAIDGQVSHYGLGELVNGRKVNGTLYDVLRKATIRPKRIVKGSPKKTAEENFGTWQEIETTGSYFGFLLNEYHEIDIEAARESGNETPALFELRLLHDVLSRPDRYYQRRNVPRLDDELAEYAAELWDMGKDMLTARTEGRHYRNTSHCNAYGSVCPYLSLCAGVDDDDSQNWRRLDVVHRELSEHAMPDGDGRAVLTNSRLNLFKSCRRKHYYRYELGIVPAADEEREALAFGTLIHKALEAWWGAFALPVDPSATDEPTTTA